MMRTINKINNQKIKNKINKSKNPESEANIFFFFYDRLTLLPVH